MAAEGVADTGVKNENDINMDIGTWLEKNRLSTFKDEMVKDKIIVNDFLQYNEDDIKLGILRII